MISQLLAEDCEELGVHGRVSVAMFPFRLPHQVVGQLFTRVFQPVNVFEDSITLEDDDGEVAPIGRTMHTVMAWMWLMLDE